MAFDLVSLLAGFLVGTAAGAAGKYIADKMTDQRRRKEERSQAADQLASIRTRLPRLIGYLQADLQENPLVREVIILPNDRIHYQHPHDRFVYYEESHQGIRNEMALLCNVGYAEQISYGNTPHYRLKEPFVAALLKTESGR